MQEQGLTSQPRRPQRRRQKALHFQPGQVAGNLNDKVDGKSGVVGETATNA